jgi:hypothetical protein
MADTDLQRLLALVPPQIRNADPSLCRLTDWVMTVSVAQYAGGKDPNRFCRVGAPNRKTAPACIPGHVFWDEPWDGTLTALEDLRDRAQAELGRNPAEYPVICLERSWEAAMGSWGESANVVSVFPAFVECVDRTEGGDINAGYREWLDRLDAFRPGGE